MAGDRGQGRGAGAGRYPGPPGSPQDNAPGFGFGQYSPGPAFVDYDAEGSGWPQALDRSSGRGLGHRVVDRMEGDYDRGRGGGDRPPPRYETRGGEARPGSFANIGKPPRNYQRSDVRILEDVCEAIVLRGLDASDVDVNVAAGEVTLLGSVERRIDRRRLEDLALAVPGVKEVHNRLRVRG